MGSRPGVVPLLSEAVLSIRSASAPVERNTMLFSPFKSSTGCTLEVPQKPGEELGGEQSVAERGSSGSGSIWGTGLSGWASVCGVHDVQLLLMKSGCYGTRGRPSATGLALACSASACDSVWFLPQLGSWDPGDSIRFAGSKSPKVVFGHCLFSAPES